MHLLLNLIPIKKGGGQQVATNFITQIISNENINVTYLVTENTFIHNYLLELNCNKKNIVTVKNTLIDRLKFNLLGLGEVVNKHKIDIIYTMFGPGLHYKNIKSVTGCAYSNLFFPEIDFWKHYSFLQRIKLKLIDKYRLKSTLKSDAIVFENEAMQKRAIKLFNYPENRTKLIFPSISEIAKNGISQDFSKRLEIINDSQYNILILSGWHKNKNIEIIPYILKCLKEKDVNDVNFIITVPNNHPESINLLAKAKSLNVEKHITFFDSVKPYEVPFLFDKIQAVALFSKLESFSNNIIEAWTYKKALIISDEEWSRAICKDSAIYVNRDNSEDIAEKILKIKSDKNLETVLINSYSEILKEYPNPQEKVKAQINFLKEIYDEKSF